jgi:hypothetical protein
MTSLRHTAIHEAGHAVAARALGFGVIRVVLEKTSGYTVIDANPAKRIAAIKNKIMFDLAGPYAEIAYRPALASHITAVKKIAFKGMSDKLFCFTAPAGIDWLGDFTNVAKGCCRTVMLEHGPVTRPPPDWVMPEAKTLCRRLSRETCDLIEQHWPAIERVAEALLVRHELDQDEVDDLVWPRRCREKP